MTSDTLRLRLPTPEAIQAEAARLGITIAVHDGLDDGDPWYFHGARRVHAVVVAAFCLDPSLASRETIGWGDLMRTLGWEETLGFIDGFEGRQRELLRDANLEAQQRGYNLGEDTRHAELSAMRLARMGAV